MSFILMERYEVARGRLNKLFSVMLHKPCSGGALCSMNFDPCSHMGLGRVLILSFKRN